jgi:hypothetical protein
MKDRCIMCGNETQYETTTHIDHRLNYIEGMGQLCTECAMESRYSPVSKVCISEKLIQNIPNDWELGEVVRNIYRTQANQ